MNAAARTVAVWIAIAAAESVHGALRRLLLEPRLGDVAARQVSVLSGVLILVAIAFLARRLLPLRTRGQALTVGLAWVVLTVAFEIGLGRALGYGWPRIASDYDLARGGLLPFGLLAMAFAPLAVRALGR